MRSAFPLSADAGCFVVRLRAGLETVQTTQRSGLFPEICFCLALQAAFLDVRTPPHEIVR